MSLNKNIESFIGQLSIVSENKNELYSMLIPIILSKKFLKNSKEKKQFVENILKFNIANYAYSSKTILIGKIINNIEKLELKEILELNKKISKLIEEVIAAEDCFNEKTINKDSFFSNWSNYINNIDSNNQNNKNNYEKDINTIITAIQDYKTIKREGFDNVNIHVKSIDCLIYDIEKIIEKYPNKIPKNMRNDFINVINELKVTRAQLLF